MVGYANVPGWKVPVRLDRDSGPGGWYERGLVFTTAIDAHRKTEELNKAGCAQKLDETAGPALPHSGSKYVRRVRDCKTRKFCGDVDVYIVVDAFGPLPMARSHAIKKLLCAGLRDKGSQIQDVREAIDALREDLKQLEAGE